jgi:hypothetical protein
LKDAGRVIALILHEHSRMAKQEERKNFMEKLYKSHKEKAAYLQQTDMANIQYSHQLRHDNVRRYQIYVWKMGIISNN